MLRVEHLFNYVRETRSAARQYDAGVLRVLSRLILLKVRLGYPREEAMLYDLANPHLPFAVASDHCISRKRLLSFQARLNPAEWTILTEDKAVFYAFCSDVGLPVPRLYGVLSPEGVWSPDGAVQMRGAGNDWARFLEYLQPETFVLKPARGVYGRRLMILTRNRGGEGYTDTRGVRYDAAGIVRELSRDPRYRKYVVQERVYNHAELMELTGVEWLQTVRAVTLIGRGAERPEILSAAFKIIVEDDNIVDNFYYGRAGNLVGDVDLETGELKSVVGKSKNAFGLYEQPKHPVTGRRFGGFRIPCWQDLRALLCEAAARFRPLRSIGWDVAVTEKGPVILEGNSHWDPLNNVHGNQHASPVRDAAR